MYSREDRIKAIELWLKYDKNLAAVVRELGYPSTKMLSIWCKAYLHEKETGSSTMHHQRAGRYSAEQKKRAVEYYFSHGRCLARTIRAVGYPCREVLAEWCEAVEPARRTQSRKRVHFSNEQKQEAVIALCSRTGSANELAKAQGVTRTVLYNWKNALLGKEAPMAQKKPKDLPKDKDQLLSEIAVLEKQVQRLRLEKDILEAAAALIKKDPGVDWKELSNREKTILIGALKHTYPVKALLTHVGPSRSSYYYQRWAMNMECNYTALKAHIIELFEQNNRCYGYRRIHEVLSQEGVKVSEKVVRTLMGEACLVAQRKHTGKYSSYQGEIMPAPENLIERDFHAEAPHQKWLTDITEFRIPAGKAYLSPVVDCFDGMLVSWTISTRPDAALVTTMLDLATNTLHDGEYPIIHTDRGCHYRWPGWLERTGKASLVRSMSK